MTAPNVPRDTPQVIAPADQRLALPDPVRNLLARAMGYEDERTLYYWGALGARKRFDDTVDALAKLWPRLPDPGVSTTPPKRPAVGAERAVRGLLTEFWVDAELGGHTLTIVFGRGESSRGAAVHFKPHEEAALVAHKLAGIARAVGEVAP